ncbi:MAG: LamG-like jellyroll fold domain-containing protein [Patescibacteria group bacterium]
MSKKLLIIFSFAILATIGSFWLFKSSPLLNEGRVEEAEAAVSRDGLTLDLNFGNNNGAAAPIVYDTSGYKRHAISVAGATSPTCNSKFCSFDGGDVMTANATNAFNSATVSIAVKFKPTFAVSDNVGIYIFDTSTGGRFNVFKANNTSNNILQMQFGNALLFSIAQSAYEQYWKKNKENVLILSGVSGNTNAYLNGYLIGNSAGGWSVTNPASLYIGSRNDGSFKYTGAISYIKVWNRVLSGAEVANLSVNLQSVKATPSRTASSTGAGLIGWWTMDTDNINGTKVYDKSGFKNNAVAVSDPTTVKGKIKQGINLNGTTQYLSVADSTRLEPANGLTVSVWIKPDTIGDSDAILGKTDGNWQSGYGIDFATGWRSNFELQKNIFFWMESYDLYNVSANVSTNEWTLITGTYDRNTLKLYKNGGLASSTPFSMAITYTADPLEIGRMGGSNDYNFDGAIDDVRIYNYALSAQEVANLYNSAKENYTITPPRDGLVGWWTMDNGDSTAARVFDKSGQGNHGTPVGFNGAPTSTTGKINQAINFDGQNGYVSMGNRTSLNFVAKPFTISAWVYPTSNSDAVDLIYSANGSILYIAPNGVFSYQANGGPGGTIASANGVIKINQWNFVSITKSGTSAGDTKLYVNGMQNDNASAIAALDGSTNFMIGKQYNSTTRNWNGKIDDVRIYNRTLSAQEIMNLYKSAANTFVK